LTVAHRTMRRLVSVCSAPLAGRDAERSAKAAMKVALVDEAKVGRHADDLLPARETTLRFLETEMAKIAVHRDAVAPLKSTTELESAHRRERREIAHRHRPFEVLVQVVANAAQCRIAIVSRRDRLDPLRQRTEAAHKPLIRGQ